MLWNQKYSIPKWVSNNLNSERNKFEWNIIFLVVETLAFRTDSFTIADLRNQEKSEPPSYEYEDLVERLYGSFIGLEVSHQFFKNFESFSWY